MRTWEHVKKKWQDAKSRVLKKNSRNMHLTGNRTREILTEMETVIVDHYDKQGSYKCSGIPGGYQSVLLL